jgi:hypothetical protein
MKKLLISILFIGCVSVLAHQWKAERDTFYNGIHVSTVCECLPYDASYADWEVFVHKYAEGEVPKYGEFVRFMKNYGGHCDF